MELSQDAGLTDPASLITDKLSSAIRVFLDASIEVWPQDALLSALHTTSKALTNKDLCDAFAKNFDKDSLMEAQDKKASLFERPVFRP